MVGKTINIDIGIGFIGNARGIIIVHYSGENQKALRVSLPECNH